MVITHLLVVIEDDDHVAVQEACVVHRLICHAACDRAVTNDGNDVILLALDVTPNRHAQACADAGAAVPGTKGVVLALRALCEACKISHTEQRNQFRQSASNATGFAHATARKRCQGCAALGHV
jgi:hypothetical protein